MSGLIVEDHLVPVGDGLSLFVRNKRARDHEADSTAPTVLFVHGATYPSSVTFDYAIDGKSWMDRMAEAGFDAWCVDLLGYGRSDRPAAMGEAPEANAPLVDTDKAVADVSAVMDVILHARGLERLCLIGYSWGTMICGALAGQRADTVARLVLYGTAWIKTTASALTDGAPPGAYRVVEAEAMRQRWLIGIAPEQAQELATPEAMAAWCDAAVASDPESQGHTPPRLRAPAGVVKDVLAYHGAGKAYYDPGQIRAATLIVVGEWDAETTPEQGRAVFDLLVNAAERRYVVIGKATHSMLLEKRRFALYQTVEEFLTN